VTFNVYGPGEENVFVDDVGFDPPSQMIEFVFVTL
jgi:hypothetical protein